MSWLNILGFVAIVGISQLSPHNLFAAPIDIRQDVDAVPARIPIAFFSWDLIVPDKEGQFDIANETGPNSSGDEVFPVTSAITFGALSLIVDLFDGSSREFAFSDFTLNPFDGLSYESKVISIDGANPKPIRATLTGTFLPTALTQFDGTHRTILPDFSAVISDDGRPLADGDLAVIFANTRADDAVPEPATWALTGSAMACLSLLLLTSRCGSVSTRALTQKRRTARILHTLVAALLLPQVVAAQVLMNVSTQPSSGVAGITVVNAIGSGFPAATLSPAGITVSLASSCGGRSLATAHGVSVTRVLGSQYRVGFVLPPALSPGNYFVRLAGTASDGTKVGSAPDSCSQVAVSSTPGMAACNPASSLGVLAPTRGGAVTAYVPNGSWRSGFKGIQAVVVEGAPKTTSIPTTDVPNSCASNPISEQTVCVGNNTDVYIIAGTAITKTLQSGSNAPSAGFSGGQCANCGVTINPITNQAVIAMGLTPSPSDDGLQFLSLNTATLSKPIATTYHLSEGILFDPIRKYILSPAESGNYDLFTVADDGTVKEFGNNVSFAGELDSAAEDCSTGIAMASTEYGNAIFMTDLTQVTFTAGTAGTPGTWTAPHKVVTLEDVDPGTGGLTGIAVAQGPSHLAIAASEDGRSSFAVLQLPSDSGTGTPDLLDYAFVPEVPGLFGGSDPHIVNAYTSPNDGKAYGLFASSLPPTALAQVDLACVLSRPRSPGTHIVSGSASSCIRVVPTGNAPVLTPVITSFPVTVATTGRLYQYAIEAREPGGMALRYSLNISPAGMTINASSGLIQWTPATNQLGDQTVQIVVNNPGGLRTSVQTFHITVSIGENHPPVITSTPPASATVGQPYSYQISANDPDGGPFSYSVQGPRGLTIDSTGLVRWTPARADVGEWELSVRVSDTGHLAATQKFTLNVVRAYPVPTLSITSPPPGSTLRKPVEVIASISDPGPVTVPFSWTVDLVRAENSETRRLGSGRGPVSGITIARIDPTLISDGTWTLAISTDKGGQTDSFSFRYEVTSGALKLGNFRTSFVDINIPLVAGIAMVITREYDSLDTSVGDFGAGWRLGLPGKVTDSASEEPFEAFTPNTRVYVIRPDGRRVAFKFTPLQPTLFSVFWRPHFTPDPGVTDTLEVEDTILVNHPGGFDEVPFGPYNPSVYKLTTKDGIEYVIDEIAGLQQIKDRNGNTLDVTPEGLTSSTGLSLPFERDDKGRITRIKEPARTDGQAGDVRYAYDANGNLISSFDQMGNETKYFYEHSLPHYLTRIVDPLNRPVTRNVYNAEGRLVALCDANGNINTLAGCQQIASDSAAQTQTVLNARGFRTDYVFDERGNVLLERHWLDTLNHLDTLRTFDENNNLTAEKDPEGNMKQYTYDSRGNKLTETDPGHRTTTYTYNSCNRVATSTDPSLSVTTYAYDSSCNLTTVTDALGGVTVYTHNGKGQRLSMTDPGGTTWRWTYDSNGYPATITDAFGKTTTLTFNAVGEMRSRVDRNGRRIDFEYDLQHRPMKETWNTSPPRSTNYTYDLSGSLTSAQDPDSTLLMKYDNLARLMSVDNAGTPGAPRVLLSYVYDQNGNVANVTDSLGGVTSYSYDALDRLSGITQFGQGVNPKRVDVTYSTAGLLTQIKRFSNIAGTQPVINSAYAYECGGCPDRLTAIRHRQAVSNSVIHDLTFTRDLLGDITVMTDKDGIHTYTSDKLQRLLGASHSNSTLQPREFYSYDPGGNRVSSHLSSSYTYTKNRLIQDATYTYAYDDEGNQIRRNNNTTRAFTEYTYDYRNRLTTVVDRDAASTEQSRSEYRYDALQRRIEETVGGTRTFWGYDRANPIAKLSSAGDVLSRRMYSRSIDGIMADEVGGQSRWFLPDHLGTVRDLVDDAGQQLTHYTYDSFGRTVMITGSPINNDLSFTAREALVGTGMLNLRWRIYDPTLGRFLQQDPLILGQYVYVQNRPLTATDPAGLTQIEYEVEITNAELIGESDTYLVTEIRKRARECARQLLRYGFVPDQLHTSLLNLISELEERVGGCLVTLK